MPRQADGTWNLRVTLLLVRSSLLHALRRFDDHCHGIASAEA